MKNKGGRKSWTEELQIAQRYSDLSEPAFRVLNSMLNSEDKNDQKWAVEQLGKAFVKMIPQDHTSGGKPISINFDPVFNASPSSPTENSGE